MFIAFTEIAPRGRVALMLACSAVALGVGQPLSAQTLKTCDTPTSTGDGSCTINSGDAVSGAHVDFTGADSTDEDDRGASGGTYTLTNNKVITVGGTQNDVLYLRLDGGRGYDNSGGSGSRGGDGGTVHLENNAAIVMEGTASSTSGSDDGSLPGIWDDPGRVTAIYIAGAGGRGGDALSGAGGGDGGDGGIAGEGWLHNYADVTVSMGLPYGGAGLYAAVVSGGGGDQDDTAGDQDGGTAGDGRDFQIENTGHVTVNSGSASKFAWGIAAESIGASGGEWNGNGGQAGTVGLTSSGEVTVTADGSDLTLGVRGIYLASVGGPGEIQGSSDASDSGGRGEEGNTITATVTGDVTVTSHSLSEPVDVFDPQLRPTDDYETVGAIQQSGGIVMYSRGGDGGGGPQAVGSSDRAGGTGGAASVSGAMTLTIDEGAQITTHGDWLPGVVMLSVGGVGGQGREDSSGAGGGAGGGVDLELLRGGISTDGQGAYGVLALSQGGPGGDFTPSSGVVDFTPANAGGGGAGGQVTGDLGIYFANESAAGELTEKVAVQTAGAGASGVVLRSFGAQGGATGDSFQLFGQAGSSTGYGGDGGDVVANLYVDVDTAGDNARGVLLQNIGSNGGDGGDDSGLVVVGGAGGAGGDGKRVFSRLYGDVTTGGEGAAGLLAQSIGGGGGASEEVGGAVAIGGQAGAGGAGGEIDLNLGGATVTTAGAFSHGIVGQSVGGGGGDGGAAFDLSAGSLPATGLGGAGGAAGAGGAVSIATSTDDPGVDADVAPTTILTRGDNAAGVIAQSVGGGGGTGGDADGGGVSIASFQMAGAGEAGGAGGATVIDLTGGGVTTTGSHAIGLLSQSVGGGGGAGGSAFSFDADLGFALSIGVGGLGGDGGWGGNATVELDGVTIATGAEGETDSHGLVVQSVGGGGGTGGSSVSKAVAKAVTIPETDVSVGFAAATALGGKGGSGGAGVTATATLAGTTITTLGDGAMGVIAQSIGGGGGVGGSASSSAGVKGGEESISASVSAALGASGGSGGSGGKVNVSLDGSSAIRTSGDHANAILAQSIGGGGGVGGVGSASTSSVADGYSMQATLGLGGLGGSGQYANTVTVALAQNSAISTQGSGARGVVAQSIGGGGGASQGGTMAVAGNDGPDEEQGSLTLNLGKSGGSGANGGAIVTTTYGSIATQGDDADGVLAQSIGGGGGLGGSAGNDAGSDEDGGRFGGGDEDTSYDFQVSVGGTGGTGGNGGAVSHDIGNGAQITTQGDHADGVVLQSIGGGGGAGGSALADGSDGSADLDLRLGRKGGEGGVGGTVTLTANGNVGGSVATHGYAAHSFVLQSIGGGGGQAGDGSTRSGGTLHLGGVVNSNQSGQQGGSVSASGYRNIETYGDDSFGLLAQSIGGGGGVAAVGAAESADGDLSHTVIAGGAGTRNNVGTSNGGTVDVSFGSNLTTNGDRAIGMVAQSIGGGGGVALTGGAQGAASMIVGGGAGNGAAVTLHYVSGALNTYGDGAHGLVAQSIGGGGGLFGDSGAGALDLYPVGSNRVTGSAGDGSSAGVTVTVDGTITTRGAGAFGVVAQSLAGGGGMGGGASGAWAGLTGDYDAGADGQSGGVSVTANKAISAPGENSVGIFAQSQGAVDNAAVEVTVNAPVAGGSGEQGLGVLISGGRDSNTLTVTANGHVSAASGVAVRYQGDTDIEGYSFLTISNDSLAGIEGNIEAYYLNGTAIPGEPSQGTASALAAARAAPAAAPPARILNRGLLTGATRYDAHLVNRGRLEIGGLGSRETLDVAGDFTQGRRGETVATVHFARGESDLLRIAGDAALDGSLILDTQSVIGGVDLKLLSAGGAVTGAFDEVASDLIVYEQRITGRGALKIRATGQSFADDSLGLTPAQTRTARYLGALFESGDTRFAPLFGDLETEARAGAYPAALDRLAPNAGVAAAAASFELTQARFDDLLDCERSPGAVTGPDGCLQMLGSGRRLDIDGSGPALGYDGAVWGLGLAGGVALSDTLKVGAMLGWDQASYDGEGGLGSSEGDTVYLGLSATQDLGATSLSAAGLAAYGDIDTRRLAGAAAPGRTATSSHDMLTLGGRLRAAWRQDMGASWLTPMADLDLIWTSADGYVERGAGRASLRVEDSDATALVLTPAIEAGTVIPVTAELGARIWAKTGVSFSTLDSYSTRAHFASASPAIGGFASDAAAPDVVGRFSAGIGLAGDAATSLDLSVDATVGSGYMGGAGSLKLTLRF